MSKGRLILVLVLLSGLMALVGCANDSETASTQPAASSTTSVSGPSTTPPSGASTSTTGTPTTEASTVPTSGKKITLSLALFIPETHMRWQKQLKPWTEEIEARSNGQVDIVPYFAESLAKMNELYAAVKSGVADMAEGGFPPGVFPLSEQIAGFSSGNTITSNPTQVVWELYKSTPAMQEEFKDTHVLLVHSSLPIRLGTVKPVKSLEQVKGLKVGIQGLGLQAKKLLSIGASVETIPASDAYMSIQRGVVDAFITDYTQLATRKYGEVLHHLLQMNITCSQFYITMNQERWDGLPPNIQEIFNAVSGDKAAEFFGDYWMKGELGAKDVFVNEMKGQTWELPAEELAEVSKRFADQLTDVMNDLEAKGYPIRDLYARFKELEKKYATDWF